MKWYSKKNIYLRRFYIFILNFGIDLKKVLYLPSIINYIKDFIKFKKKGGKIRNIYMCLEDFNKNSTEFKNQFFHSDLLISQKIFENNPTNHLDVGSRIDGLVSHLASFRSLDFADIRNVDLKPHKNINYKKIDIGDENLVISKKYFSVSSIGVLGHIGLGRYGDKIDPNGHFKAFKNIANLTENLGVLYLMVPVGIEGTEFNSHRVFNASSIINYFININFDLIEFSFVDDLGELHLNTNFEDTKNLNFGGGIFILRKNEKK